MTRLLRCGLPGLAFCFATCVTAAMAPAADEPSAKQLFEKSYLEYQLHACEGSVSRVAERVGIERTHLYRKLRSLGIDPRHIKEASRD